MDAPGRQATTPARGPAALALGSEVPVGDFRFHVHSVFEAALNLAVAQRRALVTLVGIDAGESPQGIRLATRERFDAWPVTVGAAGRREGARLVFDGADGGEMMSVDLAAAVRARRRRLPSIDPDRAAARAAWRTCARRLGELQATREADLRLAALCAGSPAPTPLGERLVAAARRLAIAVRDRDAAAADRAAGGLLGLGAGLTPTGDDLLCGLLAALRCASGPGDPDRRFLLAWGRDLSGRLAATTTVSATQLEHAIAGVFAGAVHELADAFADGQAGPTSAPAAAALDDLCRLGHSSGLDIATGFLYGLRLRSAAETRRHAPPL